MIKRNWAKFGAKVIQKYSKGLNTFVKMIFQVFLFNKFVKNFQNSVFTLSLWGIACKLVREKNEFK